MDNTTKPTNVTVESKLSSNSGSVPALILKQNNANIKQEQDGTNINKIDSNDSKNVVNDNEITIAASDSENIQNKRKKPKSRSSHAQLQYQQQQPKLQNINYSKNHLDAWLESCLKDNGSFGGPQLSSSSEFLDYNQSSFNNIQKTEQKKFTTQQQNPIHLSQQQFYNIPNSFHLGGQRNTTDNLFSSSYYFNNFPRNNSVMLNDDFASLPPIVNLNEYNSRADTNLIENNINNDPSRSFRFSDPCLINPSENESNKMSGQNTPIKRNGNSDGINLDSNKLFVTLMEQINLLHETNSKICRNLHDTRIDIETLKNVPNFGGMRHRRDSLSGISTHSQPLGGFAHSPAPTYHSGMYTPGVMTEVVREVKEAARVREDALLSRVKSMVEERSWSLGEGNLRMMRDIEELKLQMQNLRIDRKETNKRMTHLEAENKYLKQLLTTMLQSREQNNIDFLRSSPSRYNFNTKDSSKHNNSGLNIHYGVINHEEHGIIKPQFESNSLTNGVNVGIPKVPSFNARTESQLRITENYEGVNSTPSDKQDEHVFQMEKETLELRRELQEALANKKLAENRIIALENAVKQFNHSNESKSFNNYKLRGQQELSQAQGQNLSGKKLTLAGPITDL